MAAILQIDAGNSSAKWRLVESGAVRARGRLVLDADETPAALAAAARAASEIWLASVLDPAREALLADRLRHLNPVPQRSARSERRRAGVENSYEDPASMGVDRWLALLAARRRVRGRVCIVDAGTALTIDLLAEDGHHEGGYIIPGRELLERALLSGTGRVRDARADFWSLEPGRNTAAAVSCGAALALSGAVHEAIRQAGSPQPALIFCGGAGQQLFELLDVGGTVVPDLVFEGLELSIAD